MSGLNLERSDVVLTSVDQLTVGLLLLHAQLSVVEKVTADGSSHSWVIGEANCVRNKRISIACKYYSVVYS